MAHDRIVHCKRTMETYCKMNVLEALLNLCSRGLYKWPDCFFWEKAVGMLRELLGLGFKDRVKL